MRKGQGMTQGSFRLGRVPALDGLRGLAVLLVMAFHAHIPGLAGGGVGVDVFFVLSGFLITTLLVQEFDATGSVRMGAFYGRRFLRLGPALLAMLIVFCLFSVLAFTGEEVRANLADAGIAAIYMTNWARAFQWHAPQLLGHTWSLSIEEQFYLLWPVALVAALHALRNRRYVMALASGLAALSCVWRVWLVVHGADSPRTFNGLDTRADGLMIGCCLGIAFASGLVEGRTRQRVLAATRLLTPVAVVGLGLLAFLSRWDARWMHLVGFTAGAACAGCIIIHLLVSRDTFLHVCLSNRALMWVGSVSYGLYLWHYAVFRAMSRFGASNLTVLIAGTMLTIALTAASYYLLERPLLRLRHRIGATPAMPVPEGLKA